MDSVQIRVAICALFLASVAHGQAIGGIVKGGATVKGGGTFGKAPTNIPPGPLTVYVAPNGNDSNNGDINNPFATIDAARLKIRGAPGSTIILRDGNIFLKTPPGCAGVLCLDSGDSGSPGSPITYKAFPGEHPVVSAGIKLTGWAKGATACAGACTVYTTSSSTWVPTEALFYNGERRFRPRTTTNSYLYHAAAYYSTDQSAGNGNCQQLTSSEPGGPVGSWKCFDRVKFVGTDIPAAPHGLRLGDVEFDDFEKWTMSKMRLTLVNGQQARMTGSTVKGPNNGFLCAAASGSTCNQGHKFLLENVLESLNQPKQWYQDRCPGCASSATTPAATWTITYLAAAGEDPTVNEVIIPQVARLVVAIGVHDVLFQGIIFAHDNWVIPAIGLGDQQVSPNVPAALSFVDTQNVVFDGDTFKNIQEWAIEFYGSGAGVSTGNQVINSLLYDLGAGGIRVGTWPCLGTGQQIPRCTVPDAEATVTQHNTVQNNLITGIGRIIPSGIGTGVYVGNSHHNLVSHNEVSDVYSGAISVGNSYGYVDQNGNKKCAIAGVPTPNVAPLCLAHDNTIDGNLLFNLGQGITSDMGAIYFASSNTTGNTVTNNFMHDITHDTVTPDGYGGNGIYFDQSTSNLNVSNNFVLRASTRGIFNNRSDANPDNDIFPQNNVFSNNMEVYTGEHCIKRGGENPNSFTLTKNICMWGVGTAQDEEVGSGLWSCFAADAVTPVPCSQRWTFSQDIWFPVNGLSLDFLLSNPHGNFRSTGGYTYTHFSSIATFEAASGFTGEKSTNPLFTDATYPNDIYTFTGSGGYSQISFVPFNYLLDGRTAPVLTAPPVPAAFPLQLVTPTSYYGEPASP